MMFDVPPVMAIPVPLVSAPEPVSLRPIKFPAITLMLLEIDIPLPENLPIDNPRIILPLLPAPRVNPEAPTPALVPSKRTLITALLKVPLVLGEEPICVYPLREIGLVMAGNGPSPVAPT